MQFHLGYWDWAPLVPVRCRRSEALPRMPPHEFRLIWPLACNIFGTDLNMNLNKLIEELRQERDAVERVITLIQRVGTPQNPSPDPAAPKRRGRPPGRTNNKVMGATPTSTDT
jgi:hypothetical protein